MTSKYDRYSKEELVKIIEDRDRKPKFGLVWERNDIDFDRSFNQDFVALDAIGELSCGVGVKSLILSAIRNSKGGQSAAFTVSQLRRNELLNSASYRCYVTCNATRGLLHANTTC